MPIGNVPPPTQHPDEEPLFCFELNEQWIPILLGALQPLKYPEYWGGTLEENRRARKDFGILLNQLMLTEDCDMPKDCCVDVYVIQRVNVTTGNVEVSYDQGETWQPKPNSFETQIVVPPPPVTSGVAGTKCDAATNVSTQIDDWIDHVGTAFDVAVTLLEFGGLIIVAIVNAVLLLLSEGALAAAELEIIGIISAALIAVWNGGKSLFVDYWTSENKDIILCAAFCNIGDDGSFNAAQFGGFYRQCNTNLPAGLAKTLFMGFMSSVGFQGLSAMAASGLAADADCSDCIECFPCSQIWAVFGGAHGTITDQTDEFVQVLASDGGNGNFYVIIKTPDVNACCEVDHLEFVTGSSSLHGWTDCGQPQVEGVPQHTGTGFGACNNYIQLQDVNPFEVKIFFVDCS